MLRRSTIQLLRFHFSLFLLPVYLFALSQVNKINGTKAIVAFFILHFLVYPSSNGYNSYMDRDTSPIGGLSNPLQPTRQLFYISVTMDIIAIVFADYLSSFFALGILLYIIASRAYSYRGIRLKKYPVLGFLVVFICQGALIYAICFQALGSTHFTGNTLLDCLIASCLIGSLYPLTQVYQHQADENDGVKTISLLLGKRGTFVFSMVLFLSATALLLLRFGRQNQLNYFYLFLLIMLPVVLFFLYWMTAVWQNESKANFKNSFMMNVLATVCSAAFFTTLIILKH